MSEFENPQRLVPGRQPTLDDIHALLAAATPHFAGQLGVRIARLIADLPADSKIRIEGERGIAALRELALHGAVQGHAPAAGVETLASVTPVSASDAQI